MALVIVKLPVEKGIVAYGLALDAARKGDSRIAASVSTSEELRDKVCKFAQDAHKTFVGTPEEFTAYLRETIQYRLVYDGAKAVGGYIVLDGELIGLFCTVRGKGDWIMGHVMNDGAVLLDCFDGFLPKFYAKHGWTEFQREANWTAGEPDVVFMSRTAN